MAHSQEPICVECYTSCNRALANREVHERLGPLRLIQLGARAPTAPASQPSRA